MTYNASIPQSTDLISVSQGQLLVNFGQLNTQFAVDHNAYVAASTNGNGHHKQVSFDVARTAPSLSGTQSMFYPKTINAAVVPYFANAATDNALWMGGAGGQVVNSLVTNKGYMVLPNGLAYMWGTSSSGADNQAITFPVIPISGWPGGGGFLTACFQVLITPYAAATASSASNVSSVTSSGFTFRTASGSLSGFYWMAIGN